MTDCTCDKCVAACQRYPGWMTTDEAEAAIAAGLGTKLMIDYWCSHPENVYVLCPATIGYEGQHAAFWHQGQCVFLQGNRCTIHNSGFKPRMCREAYACRKEGPDKESFLADWDTERGRALVARWEEMQQ